MNLKSIGKINGYFGAARVGRPLRKKICLPSPVVDPFDDSTIFVTPEEADKKKDSSRGRKAAKTPRRLLYENYAREVLAAALCAKYFQWTIKELETDKEYVQAELIPRGTL